MHFGSSALTFRSHFRTVLSSGPVPHNISVGKFKYAGLLKNERRHLLAGLQNTAIVLEKQKNYFF